MGFLTSSRLMTAAVTIGILALVNRFVPGARSAINGS